MGKIEDLAEQIQEMISGARENVAHNINTELLMTYWQIGQLIVQNEATETINTNQIITKLSKQLTTSLGKGFSRSNLFNMRNFFLTFPNFKTISGQLSWSHYCELVMIEDEKQRGFYLQESINSNWTVRELKRQMDSSLFERLLLSKGETNRQEVLKLSRSGQTIQKAEDILRDPYVFDFLGLPDKPILEKDLERALIRHIEDFLLELGRGFMFVGSQKKVLIGNNYHYIDMVFYNKILKAYVLIDLKMKQFRPADAGQMNAYLNYYRTEINEADDNEPIGIILCAAKNEIVAEYALGGLNNQIFASKYVYYLPNKDELVGQVQRAIENYDEEE